MLLRNRRFDNPVASEVPKGLTLILSLSSVAPQAVKDAAAYFSPVVTIHLPSDDLSKPNSTETSKFIEIVN
ncbi:phosphoglycerate mutase [Colletotrichum tofieldiae]|nr:phosphoglycerate mutase [Colletotrichum tofieldiae]GKT73769.1 phosphoglycerate mutase [Colletotrichum tofieldiae]